MTSPTLLEVKDLSIAFQSEHGPIPVVSNINFHINHGETLALVGESGSGKTLTALAIMQLLPYGAHIAPTSSILLEGKDLLTYPEIKLRKVRGRRIAMIFQEAITALNPVLTIGSQIYETISCHFHHISDQAKLEKAQQLLIEVGIPNPKYYLDAYPHELSGGLKQRAMIAMALAAEPNVLIADEPTTALDVTLQAQLLQLLKTLQQKRGMGLLFITHDLGVVYQIASQVVVLYKGKMVESAPAKVFFENPRHSYSHRLFEALPDLEHRPFQRLAEEKKHILDVSDLKVYFPIRKGIFKRVVGYVKAVDGISFSLQEGRTLALVGESGSGKTTTGMAILRLLPITAGLIRFKGKDLTQLSSGQLRQERKNFQVVFQDPYSSLDPRMLIKDILIEGMMAQGLCKTVSVCQSRIDQLLTYVGLDPAIQDRYPHEFSGGQRQRICIARALAVEPKLLICDEPTSALDITSQMQILQLLLHLQQEMDLSYLIITHNLGVVAYMADDVAVMRRGEIVEIGAVTEVLSRPKHPYTQKLLAAIPTIPKLKTNSKEI